jgi:amino acid transporter
MVVFIIIIGFAAMGGAKGKGVKEGNPSFGLKNLGAAELMRTEGKSMNEYATAILGVLWAYTGWENANYVLSEVKRPPGRESRVFKVAAFASIGTLTVLYLLANIAYFAVLTNEELLEDGDIVAAKFFVKVGILASALGRHSLIHR